MYIRQNLLDKIALYINKPVIKVITGMRRVGKSCFLQQIKQFLLKNNIPEERIIIIEKESLQFDFIKNYKDLHTYIQKKSVSAKSEKHYVFIDEIQEIKNWEKTIISLFLFLSKTIPITLKYTNSQKCKVCFYCLVSVYVETL